MLGLRVRIPPVYECLSLACVACGQVEVSETGRSLVRRSPIESGVLSVIGNLNSEDEALVY